MKNELILRELGTADEPAFVRWYDSWSDDSPHWATFIWKPGMSHAEHLEKLADSKNPSKIPAHLVPSTMLYAFVNEEIVGRLSIRHQLNENLLKRGGHIGYSVSKNHRRKGYAKEMFKQAMLYCETLTLSKVLVSCADENVPSWRIIEGFGGSLENRIFDTEEDELIRRYWVDVKEALNPTIEKKEKIVAYIVRQKHNKFELLVFEHDKNWSEAGLQVPAGTVDKNEDFEAALLREVHEESGLADLEIKAKIDQYSFYREIQSCHNRRHVYCLTSKNDLPDVWTHQVTGDGIDQHLNFHYRWIPLESARADLSARLGDSIDHLKYFLNSLPSQRGRS